MQITDDGPSLSSFLFVAVDLMLSDKRSETYTAPKAPVQSFSGSGRRLGGSSTSAGASAAGTSGNALPPDANATQILLSWQTWQWLWEMLRLFGALVWNSLPLVGSGAGTAKSGDAYEHILDQEAPITEVKLQMASGETHLVRRTSFSFFDQSMQAVLKRKKS